ncbi:hypothetical protein O3P69_011877 [Scylla paramamosain]|uniref:Fibrinogen C-terminal domain-containing protein n=2 Tax=Scylla paramamosain TaxID=85552 RepID=A0AAW0SAX7_SCYPA
MARNNLCYLLWLLCVVTAGLGISAGFQDPDYLPTQPEDPLQPVWDDLDTLPLEILNGFKDQMDLHTRQMQSSLTEILSRLSSLEDKVQHEITALREEMGDLVTDRLVNAETMILEGIFKHSNAIISSVREKCDVQGHASSLAGKLVGIVNATVKEATTTCSAQAAGQTARVEQAAAKLEEVAMRVEETAAKVEETTTRVEETATKMEETMKNVEEMAAKVEETETKVEETATKVEEVAANVEETATKVEEVAANVEETATKVEEAAAKVEETATKVEEAAAKVEETASVEEAANVAEPAVRVEEEVAASLRNGNRTHRATEGYRTVNALYLPRDCSDIHWQQPEALSGVYQTFPTLDPKGPVQAYCDMGNAGAKETGGWTVILRRQNSTWGLENFNRSWVEYREGFGHPGSGEWWYGLAPLHALTFRQPFEVEFILHDLELGIFQAAYKTFRVASEGNNFRLLTSGFSGNVSYDALTSMHHGEPFSTYDKDLDSLEGNCASNNGGGWWYKKCHRAALTATFPVSRARNSRTIRWYRTDGWLVLDDVIMKIRPSNYGQRFNTYADGE